ncbi:hypothetical protein P700755_004045 [Psychroflexus torquis ATCC 700755]|uniref:Uncharacterized protein n=1 Tax=Psychroflexus torquis (strain ATCC 700755 / CIP 106069 / ACAM 623) TaxID=313595 RepID=K4IYQ1_PSYTT|nr:hypothetical protein [Psychroflexus torquis]AFU70595.1 hypothetical protein P700755_004045 [Psychroflexus torquis ATCC 700755]
MKKILFAHLAFIISFQTFSQEHEVLLTKPVEWTSIETQVPDSTKLEIAKSLDHWLIKDYYGQNDWIELQEELEKFKFIDLDMDDDLEIVYEGFSGGEPTGITILKKNSDGKYSEVFNRFGTVESFWRTNIGGTLYFELIHWPCCAGNTYSLERWNYDGTNFEILEKVNWIGGTVFPAKLSSPKKFKVLNEAYSLRDSPQILDDNILATFTAGDLGYALAERTDNTGRVWWFVFMLNNQTNDRTFYDYAYEDSYFSVGWMSSRFVELLTK